MSEMITIKSELLKWMPCEVINVRYAKKFTIQPENPFVFSHVRQTTGDIVLTSYFTGNFSIKPHQEVQVNAKDYESACIERIKEMFDDCVCSVVKRSGQAYVNTDDYDSNTLHIPINCDPRPHEDNYTIEVV